MARGADNFRWSLLPTLAAYCVDRFENVHGSRIYNMRADVVSRFGMPRSGLDRKINTNFPEAYSILDGTHVGPKHVNHHDIQTVKIFRNRSTDELQRIYAEIIDIDLVEFKDELVQIAVEVLQGCPTEKEMYTFLTVAQGLDVSPFYGEILKDVKIVKANPKQVMSKSTADETEDGNFIDEVNRVDNVNSYTEDEINLLSNRMPKLHKTGGVKFKRNPIISRYAIEKSGYKCEVDSHHLTFLKATNGKPYLEPHHVIPISDQPKYDFSLDCLQNIVALCPTCHRAIHHGTKSAVDELIQTILKIRPLLTP